MFSQDKNAGIFNQIKSDKIFISYDFQNAHYLCELSEDLKPE